MPKLQQAFDALRAARRTTLIPYLTAGYPDTDATLSILRRIDPADCACVELGIPYSDPIADGPVIQTSFHRALEAGFRLEPFFGELARQRAAGAIRVPLVAMVSYSIVHRREPAAFLDLAQVDGLVVPDLAVEEADELAELGRQRDCPLILMVAPTTTAARRVRIAARSGPFIYYQCVTGVTGERTGLPADLAVNVAELRAAGGDRAVCVGFGISRPEDVRAACRVADGAIVGSALVRRMNAALDAGRPRAALVDEAVAAIQELSDAARNPGTP